MHLGTHIHYTTQNNDLRKRGHEFERVQWGWYMKDLEGRKGKNKLCNYITHLENKNKKKSKQERERDRPRERDRQTDRRKEGREVGGKF